jgi:phenylalanyl-tRNA synthetase beta chain
MKVSIEWLGEFVSDLPAVEKIADLLTMGGLPVEHVAQVDADLVPDVEVTSNRTDCLSVSGVARELAALANLPFKSPAPFADPVPSGNPPVAVEIRANALCPHYTARVIRGVRVGPSPAWMVRRLHAIGLRSINNVVDITNYVMFELGHPLHAFDLSQVGGAKVVVRLATPGETLQTLDGSTRKLEPHMLVIADADKPIALAGVMGGQTSGVNERTVDVLLESARFDSLCIRRTARQLAMASDSSYRFERGIDPTLTLRASLRATQLILQLAGGTPDGPVAQAGRENFTPARITLRVDRMNRLLGVKWPADHAIRSLQRLGFTVDAKPDRLDVVVPSHRLDVRIEADLIEEVARVVGYEHIPTRDEVPIRLTPRDEHRAATNLIRSQLNAAGYFEALTFSFVSDSLAASFTHDEAKKLHAVTSAVRRADAQLRPSILPNLLESIRRNEDAGTNDAKLFETASVFWIDSGGQSCERRALAIVGTDDFHELRGAIASILRRIDARKTLDVTPASRAGFGGGACGELRWAGTSIGFVGKVDRAVADKLGLRTLPAIAELWLDPILDHFQPVLPLVPLPKFPGVRRDLSLLLAESVRYQEVEQAVASARPASLEAVEYVTTYRGKPLEKGTKSVTFTLCFRHADRTLTTDEVDAEVKKVIAQATKQLSATLRT